MRISINNRPEEILKDNISLAELIKVKNFTFKMLVTKVNGALVKKGNRENCIISDGDDVSIIHMISGG